MEKHLTPDPAMENHDITPQSEIFAGNDIIARYDGWTPTNHSKCGKGFLYVNDSGEAKFHIDLDYDTNWSSLMPVLEKIMRTSFYDTETVYARTFGMSGPNGTIMVRLNRMGVFAEKDLITATWKAVVDFLKEHQETKK